MAASPQRDTPDRGFDDLFGARRGAADPSALTPAERDVLRDLFSDPADQGERFAGESGPAATGGLIAITWHGWQQVIDLIGQVQTGPGTVTELRDLHSHALASGRIALVSYEGALIAYQHLVQHGQDRVTRHLELRGSCPGSVRACAAQCAIQLTSSGSHWEAGEFDEQWTSFLTRLHHLHLTA